MVSNVRQPSQIVGSLKLVLVVDLSYYTTATRRFLKARCMACVFVLAQSGSALSRIGWCASVPTNHLATIRSICPALMEIEYLAWTRDAAAARLIVKVALAQLDQHCSHGAWLNLVASDVATTIERVAEKFIDRPLIPHEQIVALMWESELGLNLGVSAPREIQKRSDFDHGAAPAPAQRLCVPDR